MVIFVPFVIRPLIVETEPDVSPDAVPVQFVRTPLAGVPSAGAVNVGAFAKARTVPLPDVV
jgi:hypothetical protein